MVFEALLHINEELPPQQQRKLLSSIGNGEAKLRASHNSTRKHLIFVAFDSQQMAAHNITAIAKQSGYHTQLIYL